MNSTERFTVAGCVCRRLGSRLFLALCCLAGCVLLTPLTGCKKQHSPKSASQKPVVTLDAAAIAELNRLNQSLNAYVKRTGQVPKDLAEAVASGALPGAPTPPLGMKVHYDAIVPTIGFVPAE